MKSLKTELEFISLKTLGTHTPVKMLNLFDYLWRVLEIQSHSHTSSLPTIFWKGRLETVFLTIKRHEIHLFLSLFTHMYVCIGQTYSVSKLLFSLLVCMYWPSRTSTPSQSEIFCLIACSYEQRQNISLWKGVVVLEGQYIHTSRENKSFETEYFRPIQTYIQAERMPFISIHPQNCAKVQNQVSCHKRKNSFCQPDVTLMLWKHWISA